MNVYLKIREVLGLIPVGESEMFLLTVLSECFVCFSPATLADNSNFICALSVTLTLWARRTWLRTTSWRLTSRSASLASSRWSGEKSWRRRQSPSSCSLSFTCQSSTRPSGFPPPTAAVRFLLAPCASLSFRSAFQPSAVEYQFKDSEVPQVSREARMYRRAFPRKHQTNR